MSATWRLAAFWALAAAAHTSAQCTYEWQREIGVPGTSQALRAMIAVDGALYIGGGFVTAGGVTVNSIATWDGSAWSALGAGVGGATPGSLGIVNAIGAHDDGGGTDIYATGTLLTAGGQPANRIARWNGAAWSPLGSGLGQSGMTLISYDDGTGSSLFVGGAFTQAGGVANTSGIARWHGSQWHAVGDGMVGSVNVLLPFDDGGGRKLYAGGTFTQSGVTPINRIARWDGATWTEVAGGMTGSQNPPRVNALAVYNDGSGARLYVGGWFDSAGPASAFNLARLEGNTWAPVGNGTDSNVTKLAVFDGGLYVGGAFATVDTLNPLVVNNVARWDGAWSDLDGGLASLSVTSVGGLATLDDGSGESLFVGGGFSTAGGKPASNVARWGCADTCYPDCNGDGMLNLADFGCFQTKFALGDPYADCNQDLTLNLADFGCFQTQFALGCP